MTVCFVSIPDMVCLPLVLYTCTPFCYTINAHKSIVKCSALFLQKKMGMGISAARSFLPDPVGEPLFGTAARTMKKRDFEHKKASRMTG